MKVKIAIFGLLPLILLGPTLLYSDEIRGCTHKQLNPPGGFISVGEASPYEPSIKEEPSPEIQIKDWNLIDSLEINQYIEAGKNFSIYFDNESDSLKVYPPYCEYPLTDESYQAIEKAPKWLRNDLYNVLSRILSIFQNEWASAINNAVDPYIDEIAFSVAHLSPEYLSSGCGGNLLYGSAELLQENAELIYENAQSLDYVEVVDYGTSETDENYYSTTRYWKENANGDTVQVEVPKEIYYWYIVHPKITDEIPAYIDPDIIEDNTTHNNNIVDPPDGVFWRNYLFNHADDDYPVLKDMLQGCKIVWNGVQNVDSTQTHATAVITNWVKASLNFTSDYERPHQPVRIYKKHIGRCGEHADFTAAAARAALIPCTSILAISHDHTWNEFWDEDWVHWEPVNNYINYPLSYENGWGWSFGSVFEIRSDGWLNSVTGTYSEGTSTITIYALDCQDNPIDGAEVLLAVQSGANILVDNYGLTDNDGKFCFTVGEGRHYYARIDTDIGSNPTNPYDVLSVVDNTVNGEDYIYSLSVSGTMPSLDSLCIDVPADSVDDYRLEIDFTMPLQIVSGRILMDDVSDFSQLYKMEDTGIIDYFMTDEINFMWYMIGNPFECFNMLPAVAQGLINFDIPADYDWYCTFANNRHLKNLQNVYGSAKLYSYESPGIDEQEIEQTSLSLLQNYPNPFSDFTMFSFFTTKNTKDTKITIYNIKGQLVKVLECGESLSTKADKVYYSILWDSKDENDNLLSSGIYFYHLKIDDTVIDTKKCLVLR